MLTFSHKPADRQPPLGSARSLKRFASVRFSASLVSNFDHGSQPKEWLLGCRCQASIETWLLETEL